jgi:hypothetical protein
MNRELRSVSFLALFAILGAPLQAVRAVNVDPGDYVALPPGTNLLVDYLQYGNDDSINIQGVGNLPAHLTSEIGIFRAVHYDTLFGVTVDPQILIPYGSLNSVRINAAPENSSSGLGDPILAMTFWPVNRPATSTYLGITPYLTLPLGEYRRSDAINLGSNRYQGDLQLGFETAFGSDGLANRIALALYADANFSSANTRSEIQSPSGPAQATLTQSTGYQLQSWLTYKADGSTSVSVGFSATAGGRQSVDGLPNGFRTEERQIRFETQKFVTTRWQLLGELTHDVHVTGGFRQDIGVNARLLYVF